MITNINPNSELIVGVDLGQAADFTAICVLQRDEQPTNDDDVWGRPESHYQVRHLERLPLGTPYPKQVQRVTNIMRDAESMIRNQPREDSSGEPRYPTPRLVVDQTGVGRPVVDMLRNAGHHRLSAVTITAGDTAVSDGRNHRVPKRELVSVLQVLLQTERLTVAAALPEAHTLTREMLAFKVTISAAGHDSYGNDWRENDHDDMVLAVALAAWVGETLSSITRLEPIGWES